MLRRRTVAVGVRLHFLQHHNYMKMNAQLHAPAMLQPGSRLSVFSQQLST
jgi:hypothetical protein